MNNLKYKKEIRIFMKDKLKVKQEKEEKLRRKKILLEKSNIKNYTFLDFCGTRLSKSVFLIFSI